MMSRYTSAHSCRHFVRRRAPRVQAKRGTLPKDPALADGADMEHAFAKTQAAENGSRGFIAHDVPVWLAPAPHRFLNNQCELFRCNAEKVAAGGDQFDLAKRLRIALLVRSID